MNDPITGKPLTAGQKRRAARRRNQAAAKAMTDEEHNRAVAECHNRITAERRALAKVDA